MMRNLYLLYIAFLFSVHSFGQAANNKEIIVGETYLLKTALINKDSIVLTRLLANDLTYGHTNGLIQTKAELIRSVMSEEQDYKNIEYSEISVRMYENASIVTLRSDVSMNYKGNNLNLLMFVTLVWVKIKEQWQIVARQSVKL